MTNLLLDRFKPAISRLYLMREMTAAEAAWIDEVREVYGERDAGMMRFKDRGAGKTGSRLNSLYLAFVASRDRYRAS
ncbi:MAG TPA: hypothetical protein VHC73_02230 [Vitreimonas sp.]|nr:hypothetical protein [Vitreimonas sp.]